MAVWGGGWDYLYLGTPALSPRPRPRYHFAWGLGGQGGYGCTVAVWLGLGPCSLAAPL